MRTGNIKPQIDLDEHLDIPGFSGKKVALYGASADGSMEIMDVDPTAKYMPSDIEEGATSYYGFVDANGGWYIMQSSSGAYRYAAGTSDYTTNWTGRAGLTYDYFYNVF